MQRFLQHFKPQLAVIVETEIWFNLFTQCKQQHIPLYLINARLSEKSTRGYAKIPSLIQPALSHIHLIATQSAQDSQRFLSIGASNTQIKTVGNIKFDGDIPQTIIMQGQQLKAEVFKGRFVWLIASTHQGEEILFLDSYRQLKQDIPELLLIIAPRHPERFNSVKNMCKQQGLNVITRTESMACEITTDIYLLDTIGELKCFMLLLMLHL